MEFSGAVPQDHGLVLREAHEVPHLDDLFARLRHEDEARVVLAGHEPLRARGPVAHERRVQSVDRRAGLARG